MIQFDFGIFFKWVGLKLNHQLWADVFSIHENPQPLGGPASSSTLRGGFDAEKICDNLERLGGSMKWMKPTGFQDSI